MNQRILSFLVCVLSCMAASAGTLESELEKVPQMREIADSSSDDDALGGIITTLVDKSLGGFFNNIDKTLGKAVESVNSVIDSRHLAYEIAVRQAEKDLEKANAANRLERQLYASTANRVAGKHRRASEILYQALAAEKSDANRRRIFYALLECYIATRDYAGMSTIFGTLDKMPAGAKEDAVRMAWYKGIYCFETGDNHGCLEHLGNATDIILGEGSGVGNSILSQYTPHIMLLKAQLYKRLGRGMEVVDDLDNVSDALRMTNDTLCMSAYIDMACADILGDSEYMGRGFDRVDRALRTIQKKYPEGSQMELSALKMAGSLALRNSLRPKEKRIFSRFSEKGAFYYLYGCNVLARRIWGQGMAAQQTDIRRELAHASLIRARDKGEVKGAYYKDLARDLYRTELDSMRSKLRTDFASMSEGQRSDYMAVMAKVFNDIYNFAEYDSRNKKTRGMVYDACLLHKSLLLSFSQSVNRAIRETGDSSLAADNERLNQLRSRLVALEQDGDYSQSDPLRAQIGELERSLVLALGKTSDLTAFMNTTYRDVQAAMENDDLAMEFYTFNNNMDVRGQIRERYIYLRHDKDPEIVPLSFPQQQINIKEKFQLRGLYMQVWKPLADKKLLKPGMNIYFSAAGRWNSIPMEYLPCGDGKYMNEQYNMVRVSTTRTFPSHKAAVASDAVLFGGLDYNIDLDEMAFQRDEAASRGGASEAWTYLPGTQTEVENIDRILSEAGHPTRSFTGAEGVEEAFKAIGGKPHHVIHVATHGYFRQNSDRRAFNSTSELYDDILDRTGLVFAGANQIIFGGRTDGLDDGHLTAREIALMDLSQTDMVVMSACESGLGGSNTEGVFGLQRGFKLAGAGTLVMSLWEVNDEATQVMMTSFYRGLVEGLDRREAFSRAQAEVRKGTFGGTPGSDPYIWNSFVIMD